MRSIRTLSGLASPEASLTGVRTFRSSGDDIQVVWQGLTHGSSANSPQYSSHLDLSGRDIIPGDLLIAVVWAAAWYGDVPEDTYGVTEITTSGWVEVAEIKCRSNAGYKTYLRVADGAEGQVVARATRAGGMWIAAVRNAQYPSGADIALWDLLYPIEGASHTTTLPALSDQTFDAVLMWHGGDSVDAGIFPATTGEYLQAEKSAWYDVGGGANLMYTHFFRPPYGFGPIKVTRFASSSDLNYYANARIGLRKAT